MSYPSNRTILEKADLALADLTAGGGILKPAQAQKFMRLLIKEMELNYPDGVYCVACGSCLDATCSTGCLRQIMYCGLCGRKLCCVERLLESWRALHVPNGG